MSIAVKKIFDLQKKTCNDDITKRWYVYVKIPNYVTGKFVWRKCYGEVNKHKNINDRFEALNTLYQLIEATGEYDSMQGQRRPGVALPKAFYTDTVFQVKNYLATKKDFVRASTFSQYNTYIRTFSYWLKSKGIINVPVGTFTASHATEFMSFIRQDKHLSNGTYNGYLTFFRGFFEEMITLQIVKINPFRTFKFFPKNHTPSLYFQRSQMDILKSEMQKDKNSRLWLFVQFIYYCFTRPIELMQLKIENIIFERGQLFIPANVAKNKKGMYVTIPGVLLQQLYDLQFHTLPGHYYIFARHKGIENGLPGLKRIAINAMKNSHRAILKRLLFNPRHVLYSWKHTGAINVTEAGGNLKELQVQLRHASLDQVDQYLKDMGARQSQWIINNFPVL